MLRYIAIIGVVYLAYSQWIPALPLPGSEVPPEAVAGVLIAVLLIPTVRRFVD